MVRNARSCSVAVLILAVGLTACGSSGGSDGEAATTTEDTAAAPKPSTTTKPSIVTTVPPPATTMPPPPPETTAPPATAAPTTVPVPTYSFTVTCADVDARHWGMQEALPYQDSIAFALAADGGLWIVDVGTGWSYAVAYPDEPNADGSGGKANWKPLDPTLGQQVHDQASTGGVANSYAMAAHVTAGAVCDDVYNYEDAPG